MVTLQNYLRMRKILIGALLACAITVSFSACKKDDLNDSPEIQWIDISNQTHRHIVIAEGTPALYNGHPTTVMLDDNKTIFCVWSKDHGGQTAFLAKSEDAGLTWRNLLVPADWLSTRNCPSIYKLTDKNGKERLMIFAARPNMTQTFSEDFGQTWSPVKSLNKPCVMTFTSIVQLTNGNYLGLYHRRENDQTYLPTSIWASTSEDGGLTWSDSRFVNRKEGRDPCEPCVVRSPNGKQLVCLMRENQRQGPSLIMYSEDEGDTWSEMQTTTWELTGDRHVAKYAPDGRLVIAFRDRMRNSPYDGHFVIWIGTYDDIRLGKPGQYRIKVLHSYSTLVEDCGYPGLEILPDGTVIAITYSKYKNDENQHSIVSSRFNLNELDVM